MRASRRYAPFLAPGLAGVLAVLMGAAAVAAPEPTARGCSARPDVAPGELPDWGLTVDGELVASYRNDDRDEIEAWREQFPDAKDVQAAQVICWAAVERMYDVRLRHGIYSVWTHNVFAGAGGFLADAHAHLVEGGRLSDLTPPHPELVLSRRPVADDAGFVIELTHPKWKWMCRVSSLDLPGDPGAHTLAGRRGASPGQPGCFSLHDHLGSGR